MQEKLRKLIENSYSPTYKYYVAAIVQCKDGKLFEGVNIETTSPAAGICAERNALYSAITAGYTKQQIEKIYIMNKTNQECYPCFVCRQTLNDFCSQDTEIITYNYEGTKQKIIKVKDLCPYPFGETNLNKNVK